MPRQCEKPEKKGKTNIVPTPYFLSAFFWELVGAIFSIMKKVLLSLLSITFSVAIYSQVPLVEYKPVRVEKSNSGNIYVPSYSNPNSNPYGTGNHSVARQSKGETIVGYVFNRNTNNFKRAKIKVKSVYGSLCLTAIYNSNDQRWYDFNIQASKVGQIVGMDSEVIRDNFEWKVENTVVGTIYFNY